MGETLQWYDHNADNPPRIDALAEVRSQATREGWHRDVTDVRLVRSGLTLQPNFQFIRHPGGGGADSLNTMRGTRLKDASVLGLRTVIKF